MPNIVGGVVTPTGVTALSLLLKNWVNGEYVPYVGVAPYPPNVLLGYQIQGIGYWNMNRYTIVRKRFLDSICADGFFVQGVDFKGRFERELLLGAMVDYLSTVLGTVLSVPANLSGGTLTAAGVAAVRSAVNDFWHGSASFVAANTPVGPPLGSPVGTVRGYQIIGIGYWNFDWWVQNRQEIVDCIRGAFLQGTNAWDLFVDAILDGLLAYFSEPVVGGDILGVWATT